MTKSILRKESEYWIGIMDSITDHVSQNYIYSKERKANIHSILADLESLIYGFDIEENPETYP